MEKNDILFFPLYYFILIQKLHGNPEKFKKILSPWNIVKNLTWLWKGTVFVIRELLVPIFIIFQSTSKIATLAQYFTC